MMHTLTSVRVPPDSARDKRQRSFREESASLHPESDRRAREQESGHTHRSVLAHEVAQMLSPRKGELLLDATVGQGGTSEALLEAAPGTRLVGLDADPEAVAAASKHLAHFKGRVEVVEGNFADLGTILARAGVAQVDKIVFDLGWNRGQLAAGRGFSFLADEPLLMSYGRAPRSGFSAREILNTWSEKAIADALYGYGEERYARRIARAVLERRGFKLFETTLELVEVVRDAAPPGYRHGRLNPATKTFQALRIAVNDELGAISAGLASAWKFLAPGGRIAVITFHSIEDRLVKRTFADLAAKEGGHLLSKKPIIPTRAEVMNNPSARSAKLRGIEKSLT